MITISLLPKLKMLAQKQKRENSSFLEQYKSRFLLQKSAASIKLIGNVYRKVLKKDTINLWIPDYFCYETVSGLEADHVNLIYYPITKSMEPDWNELKSMSKETEIDLFLFAHFFGKELDSSRARVFCDNHNALLIEDCAHVLMPYGKIGTQGDFVLYSFHKCLPVPDGAMLHNRLSETKNQGISEEFTQALNQEYNSLAKLPFNKKWLIKRTIQKTFQIASRPDYTSQIHMANQCVSSEIYRISDTSLNLLNQYSDTDIKTYAQIRTDNLMILNQIMKQLDPQIKPLMNSDMDKSPYLAVYSLKDVENKSEIVNGLKEKGLLLQHWPDLPPQLEENQEQHKQAFFLSEYLFTLPLHQQITPLELVRKYGTDGTLKRDQADINIQWDSFEQQRWEELFHSISQTNLLQDYTYGEAKAAVEHWKVHRGIISCSNREIGLIQVLIKKVAGVPLAIRVNRGPVLIEEFRNAENVIQILQSVKRHFGVLPLMFAAPELEFTYESFQEISKQKISIGNGISYSSAWIDLCEDETEIRKKLKSKWRNQLQLAEKSHIRLSFDAADTNCIIELYQQNMIDKKFQGISIPLLRYLFEAQPSPLQVLQAYNEQDELIAFDVVYCHGTSATYLVGWNCEEGRKKNVNNLLLYQFILLLKQKGYQDFDLGGIDPIHTESIAKFKAGLCGRAYRMLGEIRMR